MRGLKAAFTSGMLAVVVLGINGASASVPEPKANISLSWADSTGTMTVSINIPNPTDVDLDAPVRLEIRDTRGDFDANPIRENVPVQVGEGAPPPPPNPVENSVQVIETELTNGSVSVPVTLGTIPGSARFDVRNIVVVAHIAGAHFDTIYDTLSFTKTSTVWTKVTRTVATAFVDQRIRQRHNIPAVPGAKFMAQSIRTGPFCRSPRPVSEVVE